MVRRDISGRDDVVSLVSAFYDRVREDPLLAPVCAHVDWPAHMPAMYNFWSSILFGDMSYQGSPFQRHRDLLIDTSHFERWLLLFHQTVDKLFEGDKANEAKERARNMAGVFQHKLGLIR